MESQRLGGEELRQGRAVRRGGKAEREEHVCRRHLGPLMMHGGVY